MFSLNNNLHVANLNDKVFEFKGEKLIKNVNLKDINYLYSFANNTIVWRLANKIELVKSDYTF